MTQPTPARSMARKVAEERALLFETSGPWPALAASWRRTVEELKNAPPKPRRRK